MKIGISNILSAFEDSTIGTKVTNKGQFMAAAEKAIANHDAKNDRQQGQHFISAPEAIAFVSAGVGRRTSNPEDYTLRLHRGRMEAYLKRSQAADVDSCSLVVYTREAYINAPDVQKDTAELKRIKESDYTHILIAVLAAAGPKAPLTPIRFVMNLGGGNNEAKQWTADEIRAKAEVVAAYDKDWCVVSD